MDLSGHEGEIPMPLTRERMGLSGLEGEIPISIPIPISSTYGAGIHIQNHGHTIIHDSPPINGPGPTPPLSLALAEDHDHHHHQHHNHNHNTYSSSKKGAGLKYRECLKNHAASIGGTATDGCGEFMPSGEEGTLEALKCSACSCHRNFHRKEVEGEASSCECFHHLSGRGQKGLLIGYGGGPGGSSGFIPRPSPHHMIMPLGALQTSESDEMEGVGGLMARPLMVKKRFRTKFTPEQKEKMLGFAERAGWKLQKQEESVVQQFCQEIGVKRRVLKVWMHNNKHNLAKKDPLQLE